MHTKVAVPPAYIQVPGIPPTEQLPPTWPPPVEIPDAIGAIQIPATVIVHVAGYPLLAQEPIEVVESAVVNPPLEAHEIVVEPATYCHEPVMPEDEQDDPTMPATAKAPLLATQFMSADPLVYCQEPGMPALKHAEPTGPLAVAASTAGAVHEPFE